MGHPGLINHTSASPRLCSLATSPSRSPLSSASHCSSASTRIIIASLTTFGNTCAPSTEHHSIRVRVLHGLSTPTSYINILKGLTEGGRLCPLLWALDIADLVTTLQRSFPYITLPPPDPAYFIAILLYIDDFALLASSRAELLALLQLTLVRKQPPPLSVLGLGFPGRASASPRRRRLNAGGGEPECCSSVAQGALARGAVLRRHIALKGSVVL